MSSAHSRGHTHRTSSMGRRAHGPMGHGRIEKARDTRGTVLRLGSYLRPHAATLAVVVILVVVSTILSVLGPYFMGLAVDQFGDLAGLQRMTVLMLIVYLASWVAGVSHGYVMAGLMQKVMRALRRDLFEHLQKLSLRFFDASPHGDLMSRLTNDIDAINRALSQNVTQLISNLVLLVGILVMMFALNVWLALGSLIVLPLMMGLTAVVGMRTRGGFRLLQQDVGQLNSVMEETFSGQRVVLAFGQEAAALEDFDKANRAARDSGIRAMVLAMLIPPLMGIMSNADIAVVAGLGGWLALRGMATVGTIVTFVNYARRFAQPLRFLANLYNSIQSALAGAERVFEIIDERPGLVDAPDAASAGQIAGEVVFEDVNFAYEAGMPVLMDVSLKAEPGQTIALVGPTGAGKTTIINLLTRFYDIQDGAIRIDGLDTRQYQKESLRRQLGIVLQDTFLFSDTVMENIRYGRLDATDEECIEAAKLSNADQFIRRLPEAYQTELSERGGNLSQGQRQLLAIARAVLTDPRILILDEATSSVDTRTEQRIQEALLRLLEGRTSFVIAHRLSTIRNADRLLVINEGRIIERGTHGELLAQHGFYHNLYMSQFKGTQA